MRVSYPGVVRDNQRDDTWQRIRLWRPPEWLRAYRRSDLGSDFVAGVVVATMLVPQAMAYALLADLPVEVGLYAGLLPVALYALLGSSRFLSVGPVAMVSLLVASGIGPIAGGDVQLAVQLAITLALLVGLIQLGMGLLRAGFLVNFLSHPVLSGFTSAAAIVIGASQLKHLLGVEIPRTERPFLVFVELWGSLRETHLSTSVVGALAMTILIAVPSSLPRILRRLGVRESSVATLARCGPLVVVVLGTLTAWWLGHSAGVSTVGVVPEGLPTLEVPTLDLSYISALLPTAIVISLVGFMESFAIAQALGSKRRQRVDADQELVALGIANLGASATGGYPVTGGFSRSVVNFQAGARTGLASLVAAAFMGGTLLFLTPLLTFLPKSVLAAIILVAVASLVDFRKFLSIARFSRADGACWMVTFVGVFALGIEWGVVAGALGSIVFFLWRTSRPHVAVVGRVGSSEHFRNILRHDVSVVRGVLAIRVDESLYFANVRGLEERLLETIATDSSIRDVLLICSGINFIDSTGLDSLESCLDCLEDAGVSLSLAELKGPVADRLNRVGFLNKIGRDHIFLSTHDAMSQLAKISQEGDAADPTGESTRVADREES